MEIKTVVNTSSFGTLNSVDWKSLLWTLLIQIAAGAVTATGTYLVYVQNNYDLPAWAIAAIPVIQVVLVQAGKVLQKLLDGPTKEEVQQVQRNEVPKGFEMASGIKKVKDA